MVVDENLQVTRYDPEGYVVIANAWRGPYADPYSGNGAFSQLLLHEIGHAMNLKHPHDGWVMLDPAVDSNLHSVMTYQGGVGSRVQYPDYDVAALLWRYGDDGLGGEGAWTRGPAPLFGTIDGDDRLRGGSGADYLFGNQGDDTLIGAGGNDILVGFSGVDTMNGGGGDDSYVVFDADTLIDAGGIDTVYVSTSWTLAAEFENSG
jgi:Ca2+-binding RTX toxin-like protein